MGKKKEENGAGSFIFSSRVKNVGFRVGVGSNPGRVSNQILFLGH
jgi:hypothetical protein